MKTSTAMGIMMVCASVGGSPAQSNTESNSRDGFQLIAEQDTQTLLAHLKVVVRSGSLSDPKEFPGLAHFTARALLRGTRTRPYRDLTAAIEGLGGTVSVSVDQNQTILSASVIASNLDGFFDVLRDVLTQPAFEVGEMVLLQSIIQGELRARLQDVQALAATACTRKSFAGTPASFFPGGTVESVSKITPAAAKKFFLEHYVRENLVIGVTSPLAPDVMAKKITQAFEPIPHGVLDAQGLPAPTFQERHAIVVPREGMSTTPMYIVVPGISDGDADAPTLEVGNFVFGADFTSRLIQELRAKNGWTYGAYSGFAQLLAPKADAGLFSIYTFPSANYAPETLAKAIEMLESYASQGITSEEFEGARDALINRYAFAVDTADKRLNARLREHLNGRPFESVAAYRDRLRRLTLDQVNQTIQQRTQADPLLICVVGDPKELKPALAALPGVTSVEVLEIDP